jgi:ABC-2 type transport system permease protein
MNMVASFSAELLKLGKRPGIWLVAVVWLALELVFEYLFPYLSYHGQQIGPGSVAGHQLLLRMLPSSLVTTGIAGWPLYGGALVLVLGVLVTGSEYGWSSLKMILAQGPPRRAVMAGKLLAVAVVVMLLVCAGFAANATVSRLIAAVESQPVNWPPLSDLAKGVAVGWLVIALWSAAGMFLGVLLRGTSLAIGLGVVWVLALEQLVRGFASLVGALDALQGWLPGTNAGALVAAVGVATEGAGGDRAGVTTVVGGTQALVVVVAYIVAFGVAATILVGRRDVA